MMPGATPPIRRTMLAVVPATPQAAPGPDLAPTPTPAPAPRSCIQLGLCQFRDPPCLGCPSRHYVRPTAPPAIDPEADEGLGWAILQGCMLAAMLAFAFIGARVLAGMAWAWLGLP